MKETLIKIWKDENVQSFLHTLITEIVWDVPFGVAAGKVIGGDWSSAAWGVLGYSFFRTFARVLRNELRKQYKKK